MANRMTANHKWLFITAMRFAHCLLRPGYSGCTLGRRRDLNKAIGELRKQLEWTIGITVERTYSRWYGTGFATNQMARGS